MYRSIFFFFFTLYSKLFKEHGLSCLYKTSLTVVQCFIVSGNGAGLLTADGKSDPKGKVETLSKSSSNKSTHGASSTKVKRDSVNINMCT